MTNTIHAVVDVAGNFKKRGRFDTGEFASQREADSFRASLPNPEDYTVQSFIEQSTGEVEIVEQTFDVVVGNIYDCAKACGTLRVIQQTEDSRAFDAYCGGTRCRIYADSLEDALSEAKHWAACRRFVCQSAVVYSNQGYRYIPF